MFSQISQCAKIHYKLKSKQEQLVFFLGQCLDDVAGPEAMVVGTGVSQLSLDRVSGLVVLVPYLGS